jgi:oligogalacturonide transport system substrate-binding protein
MAILCAGLALSGCAKKEAGGSGVTLRFMWWGGDSRHKPTLEAIDAYQKKNPNVKIEAEYGGFDGYNQKLVTQLSGGTAADVIQIDQPWLYDLAARGDLFMTIDGASGIDLSGFDAAFLKSLCSYNGTVKGLPTGMNGETLIVDEELLGASGIDPLTAWTWENIVSEGPKVNRANSKAYFFDLPKDRFRFFLEKYIAQEAGAVIANDKSLPWTDAQAERAFAYLKQWIDLKIVQPFAESGLYYKKFQEDPAWINRLTAVGLTWTSNFAQSLAGKTGMIVAKLPVMAGAKDSGVLNRPSQLIVINNASKNKAEAARFVNWFFNDPEAIAILGMARGVPPTKAGRDILAASGALDPQIAEATNASLEQGGAPQSPWQQNEEIQTLMDDVCEQLGYGKLSPAQAAVQLRKVLSDKLAAM